MVSDAVILSFYTLLVVMVTAPLMIAVLMKIKGKTKLLPFLLGMLVYFTFSVVCVAFVNVFFVNKGRATEPFITGNVFVYCLYFALVIGFLDELGIYIAFKKIRVNYDDKRETIMYSLGHAGLEAVLLAGPAILVYITCSTAINELGVEGFMVKWSDVESLNLQEVVDTVTGFSVFDVVLMGLERLLYFCMHIFLSMIVFYAAKKETKAYLFIAVALRGLCTIPDSLKNYGVYTGESSTAMIMLAYTVLLIGFAGFIGIKLYRNYDNEGILMPNELFLKKIHKNV